MCYRIPRTLDNSVFIQSEVLCAVLIVGDLSDQVTILLDLDEIDRWQFGVEIVATLISLKNTC